MSTEKISSGQKVTGKNPRKGGEKINSYDKMTKEERDRTYNICCYLDRRNELVEKHQEELALLADKYQTELDNFKADQEIRIKYERLVLVHMHDQEIKTLRKLLQDSVEEDVSEEEIEAMANHLNNSTRPEAAHKED